MNGFMNRILENINRNKKVSKKIQSNVGLISKMPEDVLYQEYIGDVSSNELKNQLGNDIE